MQGASSFSCIHQIAACIRKPPNKIANNPPIRPKKGAKLSGQDNEQLKLARPITPKTDAAAIEIRPKTATAVGYFDFVAYNIRATPKMILTTTVKICRPNDSDFLRISPYFSTVQLYKAFG